MLQVLNYQYAKYIKKEQTHSIYIPPPIITFDLNYYWFTVHSLWPLAIQFIKFQPKINREISTY